MNTKTVRAVVARDQGRCQVCGTDAGLSVHHRINRGMGGSKTLDRMSNNVACCWPCNARMEADADFAREARRRGLKLSRLTAVTKLPWTPYEDPDGFWWLIDDTGCKVLFDMPDQGLLVEGEAA